MVDSRNQLMGVFGANLDHLKDQRRKLLVGDEVDIDGNDLEIHVLAHDDGEFLFDDGGRFQFRLLARFGRDLVPFGK